MNASSGETLPALPKVCGAMVAGRLAEFASQVPLRWFGPLMAIFSRVMSQIGLGLVGGVVPAVAIDSWTGNTARGALTAIVLPAVALTMAAVGCLAAIGPTRRASRRSRPRR